jgi:cellulose synthase/poly-beta-1,6-N-acetylglucosamine synthase-like glycosyltransferase
LPLGGTSNHFRTAHLRAIHGWDPFNVTEDADIGIRMARLGLKVATFESTTFEEAASTLHAWFQQRSRWLKGYMQTWLVHMRNPLALYRHGGLRGFIAFQLFIAGTFLSALSNIVLWCVFGLSFFFPLQLFSGALGLTLTHLSLGSLIAGNAGFIYLAMLGPYRRGWLELVPFALLAPVYWLLVSAAAYHGLAQLLTRPFYWAKTPHGFGRCTPS